MFFYYFRKVIVIVQNDIQDWFEQWKVEDKEIVAAPIVQLSLFVVLIKNRKLDCRQ